MTDNKGAAARFEFIGHALRGDGPFRPEVVEYAIDGSVTLSGKSYLTRYPRESDAKFARRNLVAFYDSPLDQACSRFIGYLSTKPPSRELPHDLYERMAEDIDGKGNTLDVFWQQYATEAKARGSMLLLVDMPAASTARSLSEQIAGRNLPYWMPVAPELLTDWTIGEDGKFAFAEFRGTFTHPDDTQEPCISRFDRASWSARSDDGKKKILAEGEHSLGECPLLIWTESGDFPCFGSFAPIADISKRLFNLESELDEILRSQTFSLLTMQVPDGTDEAQKLLMAQTAGQTVGTQNLIVHSGSTPAFIAPSDGPAKVYIERIDKLRTRVDIIGLNVATIDQQESGIAMQMRFQQINGELVKAAIRFEDLERRAWDLSARWVGLSALPSVEWSRDYQIADVEQEMKILIDMQSSAMPAEVIAEQQKRIVSVQFGGLEDDDLSELMASIEERERGIEPESDDSNVVPIDRNTGVREAIVRALNG